MYNGLILKESLEGTDVLKDDRIIITKEKIWKVGRRAVVWQPKVWTAIYVEGAEEDIENVADIISNSILDKWYANLSIAATEYVIFHKKIFSYSKGDDDKKQKAKIYGKSIGVPEHQLDW